MPISRNSSYCRFGQPSRADRPLADRALSTGAGAAPDSAFGAFQPWHCSVRPCACPRQALREFDFAIVLDRNFVKAHAPGRAHESLPGKSEETEADFGRPSAGSRAIHSSCTGSSSSAWLISILARTCARQWSAASVQLNPRTGNLSNFVAWRCALALAAFSQKRRRHVAVAPGALAPTFTIGKFLRRAVGDNPAYLAQRERLCDGLLMRACRRSR